MNVKYMGRYISECGVIEKEISSTVEMLAVEFGAPDKVLRSKAFLWKKNK